MEPIVLVGGGEVHYRSIQSISEQKKIERPIILVSKNIKCLSLDSIPYILKNKLKPLDFQLDLWSACQRKGVYFLEDQCLSVSREDKTLHLKKFGKLNYYKLSVESPAIPTLQGQDVSDHLSVMNVSEPYSFIEKMEQFFAEVQRHCPREVRVVFSGFNSQSVRMALAIKERLVGGSEFTDIVILDKEVVSTGGLFKPKKAKDIEKLKTHGIRVISGDLIQHYQEHVIRLAEGSELSFDILIPMDHWRALDGLGKILQFDNQKILVHRDLTEVRTPSIFVTGKNVDFERTKTSVGEIELGELSHVLLNNLMTELDTPMLECRDRKNDELFHWSKNWEAKTDKVVKSLQKISVHPDSSKNLDEHLIYQADHMSRPWQGPLANRNGVSSSPIRLNTFNGFNTWGSYALSAIKITEMAILKSLARGVSPEKLRFNLTLPGEENHILSHIFESTFRAIESVTDKHDIEIDGGDTFDGKHWHLIVTIGGESFAESEVKFAAHDYLIMTQPLGFGFLWAGRLNNEFNSSWIQQSIKSQLVPNKDQMKSFFEKWHPSGRVLIEEWGFLYHCLERLPAHQQLMLNFREVPRWEGTDSLIDQKTSHPGLDINWNRIQNHVAFKRDEVSDNNAVLWDSLSQGGLVFGFKSEKWQEALEDLKEMGYDRAALVGCIRPKRKGNPVVLSDWSPA